jgi:homoserine dehydrogenase
LAAVAVLGYGVVGSGVVEVLNKNKVSIEKRAGEEITVKNIVDIRDFTGDPYAHLVTADAGKVFEDAGIEVVVETIGGTSFAYEFTKKAFKSGKHVVTSNKELVASYGPELLRLARENGVNYLFEASVGGGIPIIRPLNQCLAANEINGIKGILNGTTNFILTSMKKYNKSFETALKEAQENGFAEADPTADVEGHDACRKIAILSSIAYGEYVDSKQIHTEGITAITPADMKYADKLDCNIKLIALSEKKEEKIFARVSPLMLNKKRPLAGVDNEFNAIEVSGDAIGDAMFYGRGAGKLPTASAVVADIIDIVSNKKGISEKSVWEIPAQNNMININDVTGRFFVRVAVRSEKEARRFIQEMLENVEFLESVDANGDDEIAFLTQNMKEGMFKKVLKELDNIASVRKVINMIRYEE